jgi:hypothetical protein
MIEKDPKIKKNSDWIKENIYKNNYLNYNYTLHEHEALF